MSHKEEILKVLYFKPLHTTEIMTELHKNNVKIGVSFDRRLRELRDAGKIIGVEDPMSKEFIWGIRKEDKNGQGVMF